MHIHIITLIVVGGLPFLRFFFVKQNFIKIGSMLGCRSVTRSFLKSIQTYSDAMLSSRGVTIYGNRDVLFFSTEYSLDGYQMKGPDWYFPKLDLVFDLCFITTELKEIGKPEQLHEDHCKSNSFHSGGRIDDLHSTTEVPEEKNE